jgi:hypothetical protein
LHPVFAYDEYRLRRKALKVIGGAFRIFGSNGEQLLYAERKALSLREDLRLYADDSKRRELLVIETPRELEVGALYAVRDPHYSEDVGGIRQRSLEARVRGEWTFLDERGREAGTLVEGVGNGGTLDRAVKRVVRSYAVKSSSGQRVAEVHQHFNPFVLEYTLSIPNPRPLIDRRLLVAAAVLLVALKGRR